MFLSDTSVSGSQRIVLRPPNSHDPGHVFCILFKRDFAGAWEFVNPVLFDREVGVDLTNNEVRIGDGITPWRGLSVATPEEVTHLVVTSHIL